MQNSGGTNPGMLSKMLLPETLNLEPSDPKKLEDCLEHILLAAT